MKPSFLAAICLAHLFWTASPDPLPLGFTLSRAAERYGTSERKLENGTIFDYMDGGGIAYLEHGFMELQHREYIDARQRRITWDVYTFTNARQALAALGDGRIAPAGGLALGCKQPHKAFRFPPDYFIYLAIGRQLHYFHVNDDRLADALNRFAFEVLNPKKEKIP